MQTHCHGCCSSALTHVCWGPAGSSTYSLTDWSSCRTLQPSPSHPRTGSGPSAYLKARQVLRINRNTPILRRMSLSPCLRPCPGCRAVPGSAPFPCPPAARSPQNTSRGERKEGAIPCGRRGYRPAPALSCWRPAASPASSAPPWQPGPVATATPTLPVATRKHFPPPRPVGERGPGARVPPRAPSGLGWGCPSPPRDRGRGGFRVLPRRCGGLGPLATASSGWAAGWSRLALGSPRSGGFGGIVSVLGSAGLGVLESSQPGDAGEGSLVSGGHVWS